MCLGFGAPSSLLCSQRGQPGLCSCCSLWQGTCSHPLHPPSPPGKHRSRLALAARLHMEPSQHDCAGVSGPLFLVSLFVPMAGFLAPKMHSRAFGTQVVIYLVPGNSQEFLSSFPSASFS